MYFLVLLIISFVYYRGYWLFFIFVILTFVFGALLVFTFLMRHYFLKLKLRNRTPGLNLKTRRPNFRQVMILLYLFINVFTVYTLISILLGIFLNLE